MRFAALRRVAGAVASWAKRCLRRQAAAANLENEAFYSSLVATMQQVVFQIDREGRFTFLNPAWTKIMGYPVEETLGREHPLTCTRTTAPGIGP